MRDNINKTVKPRHETIHHHSQSLHYFSQLRFSRHSPNFLMHLHNVSQLKQLLPSQADLQGVLNNVAMLIARITVKNVPCLAELSEGVVHHIPHKYSAEMAQKSHMVIILLLLSMFHVHVRMYICVLVSFLAALACVNLWECTSRMKTILRRWSPPWRVSSSTYHTNGKPSVRRSLETTSMKYYKDYFCYNLLGGDHLTVRPAFLDESAAWLDLAA